MTPFALSGLLAFITSICVGVFMLVKAPVTLTNRLWAYFNFAMAIWGLGAYAIGTVQDPKTALLWVRIAHIGVITIPVFFIHFASCFLEKKNRKFVIGIYIMAGFFLSILFTNLFIENIVYCFNSFYYRPSHPTSLYIIFFGLWIFSVIYSYFIAYSNINNVSPARRNQVKYFFLITTIGYTGGLGNFLPVFGIMIYPYGNFLVSIFVILTTYVILKYNLLDIRIIIRRSLIYSLVVTSITLIFFLFVVTIEYFTHTLFHYHHIIDSLIMVTLFTLIFTPLKNFIQDLVDHAFFKATHLEIIDQNEKLKAVAILASGMAHEIKNPLTPIKTFSEQLPYRLEDKEFLLKFSRIINKEVDRIDSLVQELLIFAKPSPPHIKETNINQLIKQILDLLNNEIVQHKIILNASFEENSTLIKIDPKQIKQAFLNIFLNAIQAMPNGGTLAVTLIRETKKQSFIIEISDTGCGIDPKDLPHIFDPFFTKKEKGTGLGLAITQGIIEKHGGEIKVESKLGKGTTFIINLTQEPYVS